MPKFKTDISFRNISSRNKLPTKFKGITDSFQNETVFGSRTGFLGGFFKDRFVLAFALVWAVPLVFITGYIFFTISSLPAEIPLFYSKVWGEGQLAQKNYIYLPILGAFFLGLVNIFISFILKNQEKLFTYLLMATASLLSILASITVFNIINLIS